jgi:hypothetical protein
MRETVCYSFHQLSFCFAIICAFPMSAIAQGSNIKVEENYCPLLSDIANEAQRYKVSMQAKLVPEGTDFFNIANKISFPPTIKSLIIEVEDSRKLYLESLDEKSLDLALIRFNTATSLLENDQCFSTSKIEIIRILNSQ